MSLSPFRMLLALVLALATAAAAIADAPAVDVPALIDKLTDVADSDIGYSPAAWGSPFLPLDRESAWGGGLLFQKPPLPSDTLRALVKQGAAAVPDLIAHLDDKRPTKIRMIDTPGIGSLFLNDHCDYNFLTTKEDPNPKRPADEDAIRRWLGTPIDEHVLTVGDLCFVALGQIVNRRFDASRYVPSGNVVIASPTASPTLLAAVKKEWAGLTPQRHKAALIDDFTNPDSDQRQIGACKRLAYYYPEALEPLVLKFLSQPPYSHDDMQRFVRGRLYAAAPKELHPLFDDYVAGHGQAARDGILIQLFSDLTELEKAEQAQPPARPKEFGDQPRRLLVELYGKPGNIKGADLKNELPLERIVAALDPCDKGGLIGEGLIYDDSVKIDAAVRDLMAATDDAHLALACMKRLVGRGYDVDIAKCCRRLSAGRVQETRKYFQEFLDKAGWTRLHTAVERGAVDEVRRRIAERMDVNAAAKDGRTPLHLAAEAGDLEVVKALLDGKAELNLTDAAGWTPVQLAAWEDREEVVLLLAERGCELPDVLSAANAGKTEVVELLLKKDPKQVAVTNARGGTPLHLAARRGRAKMAAALLAAGAAVDAKDKDGWRPLHLAAAGGHEDVVCLLLENKAEPNVLVWNQRYSPLHLAVLSGKRKLVEVLIDHGADLNIGPMDINGSPLHLAVSKGLPDMVALLLDRGATVDLKNKDEWTPLHLAAQAGREDVARILLDHKADVNSRGKDDRRPLHDAAGAGHRKVVELLLDNKADVGATDATGRTPLHSAAAGYQPEIVALLADRGADVNAGGNGGWTPLHEALDMPGGTEVVRVLLEHKANPRATERKYGIEPLHLAASIRDRKAVQMLLNHGAAVDAKDGDGQTPLHWAANEEDAGVVEELLAHGAAVDAQAKDGSTPLHNAVVGGNIAVVKALLDHKADPTLKNGKGQTPLDLLPTKGEAAKHAAEIKNLLEEDIRKK